MADTPRSAPPKLLDYSNATHHSRRPSRDNSGAWLALALIVTSIVFIYVFFMPGGRDNQEPRNQIRCSVNLRQIGTACLNYANAHGGTLPDSLSTLHLAGGLEPDTYICPSGNDSRPKGTAAEIAAALASSPPPGTPGGGTVSYHYSGRGLTTSSAKLSLVAYEPAANHSGKGGNVLYLNGRIEWHKAKSLQAIVTALNAGQNPPP